MGGVIYDLINVLGLFQPFCNHEIFVKLNLQYIYAHERVREITKIL